MNAAIAINTMALSQKIPKGDKIWQPFNLAFENRLVEPQDFAHQVFMGHAYTSWHDPAVRKSDNWRCSQFLAVDFDTKDERSNLEVLLHNDLIRCYGTVLHTTPSHTKEQPRARVVFFLDKQIASPQAYAAASLFLAELLGGDTQATDVSRFFYGCKDGEIRLPARKLPVDFLRLLYKRHRSRRQPNNAKHHPSASLPRHDSTEGDIRQAIRKALECINPWDVDYLDWVAIIGAIKYELGDEGLSLALEWADGKEGEVERMWRSLNKRDGNIATKGKIIYHAAQRRH